MATKQWEAVRKQIHLWVEPADYSAFEELAKARGLSVAEALRQAMLVILEHEGPRNGAVEPQNG